MDRAGFILALAAGFFSVFLLVWQGWQGASAEWVYGFLAVFWSLLMMLRLMTLTTPAPQIDNSDHLARKIMGSYHKRKADKAVNTLETSFGGSFFLFVCGGIFFAAWQIYCAAFPAEEPTLSALSEQFGTFFGSEAGPQLARGFFFEWGHGFMLLLSFLMMGFVLRSHAVDKNMARPALLVLGAYALAGYITFAGLEGFAKGGIAMNAGLSGSGRGAAAFLMSTIPYGKTLSLFDLLLLETGITGLALLTFVLFVPLGFISLSAHSVRSDKMVACCGFISGVVLILSTFLAFTPALAGLMALCWMAVFLAWGNAENTLKLAKT